MMEEKRGLKKLKNPPLDCGSHELIRDRYGTSLKLFAECFFAVLPSTYPLTHSVSNTHTHAHLHTYTGSGLHKNISDWMTGSNMRSLEPVQKNFTSFFLPFLHLCPLLHLPYYYQQLWSNTRRNVTQRFFIFFNM